MALGVKKLHLVDETPIQYLETLSKELGIELYMKRDDLTYYGAGGNKLRKLEYLAQEASRDSTHFITELSSKKNLRTASG